MHGHICFLSRGKKLSSDSTENVWFHGDVSSVRATSEHVQKDGADAALPTIAMVPSPGAEHLMRWLDPLLTSRYFFIRPLGEVSQAGMGRWE